MTRELLPGERAERRILTRDDLTPIAAEILAYMEEARRGRREALDEMCRWHERAKRAERELRERSAA